MSCARQDWCGRRGGRNGGWSLARPAADITLADVRQALGEASLFAVHPAAPDPGCYVGFGIQPGLKRAYDVVEHAVHHELPDHARARPGRDDGELRGSGSW